MEKPALLLELSRSRRAGGPFFTSVTVARAEGMGSDSSFAHYLVVLFT